MSTENESKSPFDNLNNLTSQEENRRDFLKRFKATFFAAGVGILGGVGGTLLYQKETKKDDGFIFLNGINFPLEPSSDWKKEDYFNFFDKVFSEFRKAKLVVSLPRDPNNYVEREEKVEFRLDEGSALSSSSVEYTLIRGRLENKDLMRQLIIKESDVRNPKTDVLNSNLTFYGPNPYDPMVTTSINGQLKESKQITGGLWNFYSRKLLFDFNKYAKEYNKRIIERRNREKYPWLANS